MIIRGEEVLRIHLKEIAILIIESTAVSLTAALLCELTKEKIKVIFCDEKHNPQSELISLYGSHDVSKGVRSQIAWKKETKEKIWQFIIKEKIEQQANVLAKMGRKEAAKLLQSYANEVEIADATNREGHAAKVYFNALFGTLFSRDQSSMTNAVLDYGYAIILSAFNREVVSQGRLTSIGIWHDNMFNYFNLSSDLMEAFRPKVDLFALELLEHSSANDDFDQEKKHEVIKILEENILINNTNYKLLNAIKVYVQKIVKALDDDTITDLPQIRYV